MKIILDKIQQFNLKLILDNLYPLNGFMNQKEYNLVLDNKTLYNGIILPIPICLQIEEDKFLEIKDCKEVILAADEDREGEMIASSLSDLLGLKDPKRIIFHEITKKALNEAVKKPTKINYNMVNAQQARRLLDRLVGYKISPIL